MATDIAALTIIVLLYLLATVYLGYRGWRSTKNAEDYMVAGRKVNPYIMALSYGATFISTSAIVGFGGTAGKFGMGLLWLTFLNIFLGIFIAFILYGKRTRKIGHNLGAMTFPEIMSKRFDSKFLQVAAGLIIFFGMPVYAAAVLIGGAWFLTTTFAMDYNIALLIFSVITAAYVVMGGLKGVMYTDAFQAVIMLVGMIILLVSTYSTLGGITPSHQALTDLASKVPANLKAAGMTGWTSMPVFNSPWWWTLVSSIVLGVGIGVLAVPQLAVRFMTVKSNRELNRAVAVGGFFILMMTGVAFTVGALSNVYFMNTQGKLSIEVAEKGNSDTIIPLYINSLMKGQEWFIYLFLLTLLAAAMSTLSSQIHTQGTALGRDIYETLNGKSKKTMVVTRLGVIAAIIMAVMLSFNPADGTIARGTAIFFGICAAAFLPMYTAALFWKRATKEGAIASLVVGALLSLFWMVFVHAAESKPLGIAKALTGKDTIIDKLGDIPLTVVDPIVVALPISVIVLVAVSLMTMPPGKRHLEKCFKGV
jgi:SSS family solute:Na+ symporter